MDHQNIIPFYADNIKPKYLGSSMTYFNFNDIKKVSVPKQHEYKSLFDDLLLSFPNMIIYQIDIHHAYIYFGGMQMCFSFSHNETKVYIKFAGKSFRFLTKDSKPYIEFLSQVKSLQEWISRNEG